MTEKSYDVAVVGAGIIGASCAFELAKAGARVALLEKRRVGQGASGNSAAMLECQVDAHRGEPFLSIARASLNAFPALSREIKDLTGIDFDYEIKGILHLALTHKDAVALQADVEWQRRLGFGADWLSPSEVKSLIPRVLPVHQGGLLYKNDGQVDGRKYLNGMLAAAEKQGVELFIDTGNLNIRPKSNSYEIQFGVSTISAEQVVIAAGAWTDFVLKPLGHQLNIEPVRGQLVVFNTPTRPTPIPIYTRTDGYITPKNGYTLAGTTVERAGFDENTTEAGRASIMNQASVFFADIGALPVQGLTAGLRPKSPDELPFVGFLNESPRLLVAAGHYRNGILLAPITAQLITDMVLGRKPIFDPSPLDPFRGRAASALDQKSHS